MKILVDIGNSRIKWCWYRDGSMHSPGTCNYTIAELSDNLDSIWSESPVPSEVSVSCVRGKEVIEVLTDWLQSHWNVIPEYATVSESELGVTNGYEEYNRLGIDRWLALLATWNRWKKPACVVDCGTAITIDSLDGQGNHLGGYILPGLHMMLQTLHEKLPVIPEITGLPGGTGYARSTMQGVSSGCLLAVISLIERVVEEMQHTFDNHTECVITGGDAGVIMEYLSAQFHHRPMLVLEGLAIQKGIDP